MSLDQTLFFISFTHLMGSMARDRNYPSRPSSSGGDLGDLLDGVELNLLDSKLVGFGFVREELVNEVCIRATRYKQAFYHEKVRVKKSGSW